MKKKLDAVGVMGEMRQLSAHFRQANAPTKNPTSNKVSKVKKTATQKRSGEQVNARTPEHLNRRTGEQANARTGERLIKRFSFNLYKDQFEDLRKLELERKLAGENTNLSAMVREFLDDGLKKAKANG